MVKPAGLIDYRRSPALDLAGAAAVAIYVLMSWRGPPPIWAQASYLAGCTAGGVAAGFRRDWFPIACCLFLALFAGQQLLVGTWIVK